MWAALTCIHPSIILNHSTSHSRQTEIQTDSTQGGGNMRFRQFLILALPILLLVFASCAKNTKEPVGKNTAPYNPYLHYPLHNSTDQSRTPFFSWNCTDPDGDALTYELSLVKDDVEIFNSGTITDTLLYYSETLDENTLYSWKVTANDGESSNSNSYLWDFTTGTDTNNPPYKPYNMNPHGPHQPITVTLEWECFDPDGDPLTFDVWIGTDSQTLTRISAGQSETSHQVSNLNNDTRYLWRIDAFDSHGASAYRLSDFTTSATASPDPPFDPYPADAARNVPIDVTLSWSDNHPDGLPMIYDVYFGPAGASPPAVSTGQADTFFIPPALQYNTTYDWRVVAEDQQIHRAEGPLWSFTTEVDPGPTGDIYAELIFGRSQSYNDFDQTLTRNDMISARFDSVYAPDGPIKPVQAAGVRLGTAIGGYDIPWNAGSNMHYYSNPITGYFLDPGSAYVYVIEEGDGVPALIDSLLYPACHWPYITIPAGFSFVPRTGFELQWANPCGGTIIITIEDLNYGPTDVYIVTEDDGSYTFTAGDLSVLDPLSYQLQIILVTENRKNIIAPGYDPRSFIWARTFATQFVYLDQ
jgi:hypothetical protein